MELYKFRIDGIYDLRTLKELKREGLDHFCFDFNPRSFNFIPEHIFLELLTKFVPETDKVFLHFVSNKDPMVSKIYYEILKIRGSLHNIYFEFDEYFSDAKIPDAIQFLLQYSPSIFLIQDQLSNLAGFIFSYKQLDKINHDGNLVHFYGNFFTHFNSYDLDSKMFVLKLEWHDIVQSKCIDLFDFNIVSLALNADVEVCYRNVDFSKLKQQFESKRKIFKKQIQF